ncbi:MAG: hypothetical protein EOQ55_25075 [Mesorhizobium sp.]|uniref:hypothetical protein n=3 Tax=Mesorhizobium sp. TaxID=1871066 RepID=UPI000FC9A1B1|nr:hypothetical protein [Mesorhizobium sp.]RUV56555.1 hypothetical protein EOA64_28290 [Mesorhizobium sp. M1A.F.Ca.IN.022.02.1.1]RWF99773.1 MAG: hypothetical protein EOQ54_28535 [Mesorhizobium sp.]RWG13727.1 MAG: hypothetical protein EOQ55_25075 [Mesorhizobium sp.]RWG20536.1 MAG: hypothetical protein EOQ53_09525 [Mesorhizobium sp.]RWG39487.1 MAG: hypothetical protein EOQ59_11375 [Mesorhizobium sp.]
MIELEIAGNCMCGRALSPASAEAFSRLSPCNGFSTIRGARRCDRHSGRARGIAAAALEPLFQHAREEQSMVILVSLEEVVGQVVALHNIEDGEAL